MKKSESVKYVIQILKKTAEKYTPKNECCWVSYVDGNKDLHTYDDLNHESYCEDCITKKVDELNENHPEDKPAGLKYFEYQVETSPEKDNPTSCSMCGEKIDVSVLWSENNQEYIHYAESDIQLSEIIKDPRSAHDLHQYLNESYKKSPLQCEFVASRLVKRVMDHNPNIINLFMFHYSTLVGNGYDISVLQVPKRMDGAFKVRYVWKLSRTSGFKSVNRESEWEGFADIENCYKNFVFKTRDIVRKLL